MSLHRCPKCGTYSYERLKTHSYCFECQYSPTFDLQSEVGADDFLTPDWAIQALIQSRNSEISKELILKNEGEVIYAAVA